MSVGLYDTALEKKLRAWVKSDLLTITGPNETRRLFLWKADTNGDLPIQLPLVAITRDKNITILNTSKKSTTYEGATILATKDKIVSLCLVPIELRYSIDIYTRYLTEGDEYLRNFIFNIINYPLLLVEIPYNNLNYIHNSNIRLIEDILDNSDIPERLIEGLFTRFTIQITIDDAYLWSVPVKDTVKFELEGPFVKIDKNDDDY